MLWFYTLDYIINCRFRINENLGLSFCWLILSNLMIKQLSVNNDTQFILGVIYVYNLFLNKNHINNVLSLIYDQ